MWSTCDFNYRTIRTPEISTKLILLSLLYLGCAATKETLLTRRKFEKLSANLEPILFWKGSKQLVSYININQLFPDRQSAYRATLLRLSLQIFSLTTFSNLLAMDSGNFSLLSLLELSAAFDTVVHHILLRRLHLSLFSCHSLRWSGLHPTMYLFGR